MSKRTLEATAVHTVTLAASHSADAQTVACDVRDMFHATTRALDASRVEGAREEAEVVPNASPAVSTGECTKVWTRRSPRNVSTAAFAQTELLAFVPSVPVRAKVARTRTRLRTALAIVGALGVVGVLWVVGAAGVSLGRPTPPVVNTSPGAKPHRPVETTPAPRSGASPPRSADELTALEVLAADALLAGQPDVALTHYRELAEHDAPRFARVVRILERAP